MTIVSPTRGKACDSAGAAESGNATYQPNRKALTKRRLAVVTSAMVAGGGLIAGMGIVGMAINDGAHGSFATTRTLLNPSAFSHAVWTPIYLGLLAYVAWQMTLTGSKNKRAKSVAKLAALSMLLNALWILTVQVDMALLSLVVIAALAINLAFLVVRLSRTAPRSRTEWLLLDGVFGLYLGWVLVSALANAAIVLHLSGLAQSARAQNWLAIAGLLGVVIVALIAAVRIRITAPMMIGLMWGTFTIGIARISEPPYSVQVSLAAFAACSVMVGACLIRGVRRRKQPW